MERNNKAVERRRFTRVALDAYISATLTDNKSFHEKLFMSKNLSPEGIFLACNESFPVGTVLSLKIHTPTTSRPIVVEAKVVRIQKDKDSHVVGMGLAFVHIDEADKKELMRHLYLAYHYLK